jgi:hypothetical protein
VSAFFSDSAICRLISPCSAFSALPDSLQFDQGSHTHCFRIRDNREVMDGTTGRLPNSRPVSSDGFLYGFSYFTRRKETTSERGYQQVNVTDLSPRKSNISRA